VTIQARESNQMPSPPAVRGERLAQPLKRTLRASRIQPLQRVVRAGEAADPGERGGDVWTVVDGFVHVGEGDVGEPRSVQDRLHGRRVGERERVRPLGSDRHRVLHYQPKIDPRTRRVVGVEALVRWDHPTHGPLYPDTFLPLAEQTGLMRQLTLTVLQTALREGQAWRQAGLDLPVAVNLSVANLLDAHLARQVGDLLAGLGLPPRALELELTEDTLMADPHRSRQVLADLRALGLRLSVDDYGTGYSSLAYLQELAVDELKLDKTSHRRCRQAGQADGGAHCASSSHW
jgi:EAL domain-containing protein (putative c-di-GMP-specific phosphodiesterase class I)